MTSPAGSRPPLWRRATWTLASGLIRGAGRLLWGLRVKRVGAFPEPPFVVAANHHSFLDPPLVGAACGERIRFLALVDLFGQHRWLDLALEVFEAIPIHRGGVPLGALRAALAHLEAGGAVGLFPEGTRHWEFDPDRARPGAAWLAVRAGVPLLPVAIQGTDRVLGVDNRLHRGKVRVTMGPPLVSAGADRAAVADLHQRWGRWVETTVQAR